MTNELLKVTDLIRRGWARPWMEDLLGAPRQAGASKVWPLAAVLAAEASPIFIEACGALRELMQGARYRNGEIEQTALALARKRVNGRPAVAPVDRPQIAATRGAHVWRNVVPGGIEVEFANGLRIAVPQPFLDALQRSLGANAERFAMGLDLVLADWEASRVMPANAAHGRAYFLGSIKYSLVKLAAMEAEAPRHAPDQAAKELATAH